ncbi:YbfB/YjiJ family MFS transporter [Leucothrix pacifica]|uniref:MFS transporter n=1 Tax=Leucothrix pacifica TaxID=1247513 RepID=A0A317CA51_9GAMM|nr:YbfB/YjiJ family MFS transporter [Leucothrix pacifica]PWQ95021.1 MFS transporter [Leucothrix pacifica]
MTASTERLRVLTAGILSLILLLGIARFAYTPLLPIMQNQAGLGVVAAGWLATINYVGYLCGAIIASQIGNMVLKDKLYRLGLIVAVLTTVGMGMTTNVWLWSLLRFFAGLSSAAGLLLASALIMNWLIRHDFRSELGIHFSGLGLGIAVCAIVVEILNHYFSWDQQWYILSALGVLILIPAWAWLPPPDTSSVTKGGGAMTDNPPSPMFLRIFMLAYFCAGIGYVVSATFIVAIVDALPGLAGKGAWVFMVLGLAAAPACMIWDLVARRTGDINALILAAILQIVGIMLPILSHSLLAALIGAVLFGGTFIGLVSLVLSMAGRYYPTRPAKMMGKMTISYGLAQIIAPLVVGWIAKGSGGYEEGLYLAAGAMVVAVGLLLWLRRI